MCVCVKERGREKERKEKDICRLHWSLSLSACCPTASSFLSPLTPLSALLLLLTRRLQGAEAGEMSQATAELRLLGAADWGIASTHPASLAALVRQQHPGKRPLRMCRGRERGGRGRRGEGKA